MELEVNGRIIETDAEGYLTNLEDWTPEVAEFLSQRDNLVLTDDHWRIINFIRQYFEEYGTAPNLRILQKTLKEELGEPWGDKRFLFNLFPFGPAKQAGRYAGVPKPTGCV